MAVIISGPDKLELAALFFKGKTIKFGVADRKDCPNKSDTLSCVVEIMEKGQDAGVILIGHYTMPKSKEKANFQATYKPDSRSGSMSFMGR